MRRKLIFVFLAVLVVGLLGACADMPRLTVSPTVLDFGEEEVTKSFTIENTGIGEEPLTWEAEVEEEWVTLDKTSGTGDAVIEVTVDRENLDGDTYVAIINVTSNGGEAEVGATMVVQGEAFSVSPTSLNFGKSLTELSFDVENRQQQDLEWTVDLEGEAQWVSFDPEEGINDGTVTVTVDRVGIEAGDHTCYLKVTSDAGNFNVSLFMEVAEEPYYLPDLVDNVYLRGVTAPEGTVTYSLQAMELAQMPTTQAIQQSITLDEAPEPTMELPSGYEAGFVLSWDPVDDVLGYRIYYLGLFEEGDFYLDLFHELPVEDLEDPDDPTYAFVDDWYWVHDVEVFAVLAYNEYGESPLPDTIDIENDVRSFWDWGMIMPPLHLSSPAHGTTAPATPIFMWNEGEYNVGYSLYLLKEGDFYWEDVLSYEETSSEYPGVLDATEYQWYNLGHGLYCGTNPSDIGYPVGLSLSETWDFTVE